MRLELGDLYQLPKSTTTKLDLERPPEITYFHKSDKCGIIIILPEATIDLATRT